MPCLENYLGKIDMNTHLGFNQINTQSGVSQVSTQILLPPKCRHRVACWEVNMNESPAREWPLGAVHWRGAETRDEPECIIKHDFL